MEYSVVHKELSLVGIMVLLGAFQTEFDPSVSIKLGNDPNLVASYPSGTCQAY